MLERITQRERKDLIIAWLAISLAFTFIFVRQGIEPLLFLIFFGISLGTVGIGFVVHEMAHKFTAMKYGYWAEFHKDNSMLLIAVILAALVGIVFAAPGATVIHGMGITREQNGRISAAGPLSNLVLWAGFFLVFLASIMFWGEGSILWLVGLVGMQVNGMIAAFNMLPVSILDGRKVFSWNPGIFVALILASFGALIVSLQLPELLTLLS
jgi:Zn-dependent protease